MYIFLYNVANEFTLSVQRKTDFIRKATYLYIWSNLGFHRCTVRNAS